MPSSDPIPIARPGMVAGLADRPYLLLLLVDLLWAGNIVLGRAVAGHFPPVALSVCRWAGAFLVLLPFARRQLARDLPVLLAHWRMMLLLSALGIAAYNTIVYSALHHTSAINGLLLQSMQPVFIVLLTFLLFREPPTPGQAIGILVSLLGVAVVVLKGDLTALLGLDVSLADLVILGAVAVYAAYTAMLRLRPRVHALSFLAALMAIGSVMLLPLLAWEWATVGPVPLTFGNLLAGIYVAVFPSLVAYWAFNRAVELVGANRAGIFLHLIPVLGSLMALVLLGEHPAAYHVAGFVLVLAGIALANRRRRSKAARVP